MQKQQSALTVTLKLIISGLTSVILIVLSTINLQFPHLFSLRFLKATGVFKHFFFKE